MFEAFEAYLTWLADMELGPPLQHSEVRDSFDLDLEAEVVRSSLACVSGLGGWV